LFTFTSGGAPTGVPLPGKAALGGAGSGNAPEVTGALPEGVIMITVVGGALCV
jgi:hypothetical protein